MAESSVQVAVIGAGIAGLTAAAWLTNHGVADLVVLEAQDYVGGRVKALAVDGGNLDLGAQYIHGREGNPVYDVAEKLGIVAVSEEDAGDDELLHNIPEFLITSKGEKIPFDDIESLIQFFHKYFEESWEDDDYDTEISEGELRKTEYEKFLSDQYGDSITSDEKELYDAAYRWFNTFSRIDISAADLHDVSAWGQRLYTVLKGERFTEVVGGMTSILKAVENLIPPGHIRLNTPVSGIDCRSVQDNPTGGKVVITCSNGDVVRADHVILTASIGYVKACHEELFQPALPPKWLNAMQNFHLGSIGKVFLKWEKPFWERKDGFFDSIELLWLDSHPISVTSDRCQRKTKFGKPWWHGLHSLETHNDNPNILELWLTADQTEIAEELEDDEVKAVCHEVIQAFFKDVEIPEPVAIYRTKWLTNPYTRGTYTYPAIGVKQEHIDEYGKPLPSEQNPRVLFAGEGYHMAFHSTFHGAMVSGQDQADVILKQHGISTSAKLVDFVKAPTE